MTKEEKHIRKSIATYAKKLGESGARKILKKSNVGDIRVFSAEMVVLTSQVERRSKHRKSYASKSFSAKANYGGDDSIDPWQYQQLNFSKSFREDTKQIELPESARYEACSNCAQTGTITCHSCGGKRESTCSGCRGTGKSECNQCNHVGTVHCYYCSGTGRTDKGTCTFCFGAGRKRCPNCSGFKTIQCSRCSGTGNMRCVSCSGSGRVKCNRCDGRGGFKNVLVVDSTSRLERVWTSLIPDGVRMEKDIKGALKPDMLLKISEKDESKEHFLGVPTSMKPYDEHVENLFSRYVSGSKYRVLNQRLEVGNLPILQFTLSMGNKTYEASCVGKNYELVIDSVFLNDISAQYEEASSSAISDRNIGKALKWLDKTEKLDAPGVSNQTSSKVKVNRAIFESIQFAKTLGLVLGFGLWSWLHFFLMKTFLFYPNWARLIFAGETILGFTFIVLLFLALRWKPKIAPRVFKYSGPVRWIYFSFVTLVVYVLLSALLMIPFYLEKMDILFLIV